MSEFKQIIIKCQKCGNTGLNEEVVSYLNKWHEWVDGEPTYQCRDTWKLLKCPVCQEMTLLREYEDDLEDHSEPEIVYPSSKYKFGNVPTNIMESYKAALATSKIDAGICLVSIRKVLEMICVERGTTKKKLYAMLNEMVAKNIFPETLNQCSFLIRKLGNSGVHEDFGVSKIDLEELLDFIETIMYYIYELPRKIEVLKDKYKLENSEELDSFK